MALPGARLPLESVEAFSGAPGEGGIVPLASCAESEPVDVSFFSDGRLKRDRLWLDPERDIGRRKRDFFDPPSEGETPGESEGSGSL